MRALLRVETYVPQNESGDRQDIQCTAEIVLTENSDDMTTLTQVSLPQDIDWRTATDLSFNPDSFEVFIDHATVGRYVIDLARRLAYPEVDRDSAARNDSTENPNIDTTEGIQNDDIHMDMPKLPLLSDEELAPEAIELQEFLDQSRSTVSSPTVPPGNKTVAESPTPKIQPKRQPARNPTRIIQATATAPPEAEAEARAAEEASIAAEEASIAAEEAALMAEEAALTAEEAIVEANTRARHTQVRSNGGDDMHRTREQKQDQVEMEVADLQILDHNGVTVLKETRRLREKLKSERELAKQVEASQRQTDDGAIALQCKNALVVKATRRRGRKSTRVKAKAKPLLHAASPTDSQARIAARRAASPSHLRASQSRQAAKSPELTSRGAVLDNWQSNPSPTWSDSSRASAERRRINALAAAARAELLKASAEQYGVSRAVRTPKAQTQMQQKQASYQAEIPELQTLHSPEMRDVSESDLDSPAQPIDIADAVPALLLPAASEDRKHVGVDVEQDELPPPLPSAQVHVSMTNVNSATKHLISQSAASVRALGTPETDETDQNDEDQQIAATREALTPAAVMAVGDALSLHLVAGSAEAVTAEHAGTRALANLRYMEIGRAYAQAILPKFGGAQNVLHTQPRSPPRTPPRTRMALGTASAATDKVARNGHSRRPTTPPRSTTIGASTQSPRGSTRQNRVAPRSPSRTTARSPRSRRADWLHSNDSALRYSGATVRSSFRVPLPVRFAPLGSHLRSVTHSIL